jgi:hypothetical protein
MQRLPLLFLATAALCLVVGVSLGIAMGIAHDFTFAPVHAHLNLLGWTSLALMGLTFRAYPELGQNRVALLFPIGIAIAIDTGNPAVAIGMSLIWFAGAVLFLSRLVLLAFRSSEVRRPSPLAVAAE